MSNAIFPTLRGLGWPVNRKPYMSTIVSTSASGQQVRIPNYPFPMEQFDLPVNHLHGNAQVAPSLADFQTLYGFYVQRLGPWDSFLYFDPTDNYTCTNALYEGLPTISGLLAGQGQNFIPGITGTFPAGDGTTLAFQLYANQGGAVRPIFDINGITASQAPPIPTPFVKVYVNGSAVTSGWTVSTTGMLTFGSPPANNATIAVDFGFFKRVRFQEDFLSLENFMSNLYRCKSVKLEQVWA
jgi:hypothetical protein